MGWPEDLVEVAEGDLMPVYLDDQLLSLVLLQLFDDVTQRAVSFDID